MPPTVETTTPQAQAALPPLLALLDLSRQARRAASAVELQFMAVNDAHRLAPYRQAALWFAGPGVQALSGVIQVEANVPYVLWLNDIATQLNPRGISPLRVDRNDLTGAASEQWNAWLPAHGLWLPIAVDETTAPVTPAEDQGNASLGGLLLARDEPWSEQEITLLAEWIDVWTHEWQRRQRPQQWRWHQLKAIIQTALRVKPGQRWWQTRLARLGFILLAVLCLPVRLTVLAPGELVPANPAVIRAPLEGVIDAFHVQPNDKVSKGQPLFGFDEALVHSKLDVSRQALATAEAEYRQTMQQALSDTKSKAQLALITGKIEERRAEVAYLADQLNRTRVLAPQDGIVLFDDPSEWIGKPVVIGERIMRIATPGDVEVEAWVPLADAIPLAENASVSLYLNASPLSPVAAGLRYFAHDAIERPDGNYAYRLRARLSGTTDHRVGLKGTARIQGHWVPLVYWVLRRPLAGMRAYLGW